MPTSASDIRHGRGVPVIPRRRARTHAANAANGRTATVMSTTPVNVPTQPCQPLTMPPPQAFDGEMYPGRPTTAPRGLPDTVLSGRSPEQAGPVEDLVDHVARAMQRQSHQVQLVPGDGPYRRPVVPVVARTEQVLGEDRHP